MTIGENLTGVMPGILDALSKRAGKNMDTKMGQSLIQALVKTSGGGQQGFQPSNSQDPGGRARRAATMAMGGY